MLLQLMNTFGNIGAQYLENCSVDYVITENNTVKGVQTDRGFISCEYFVNCAGMVRSSR